MLLQECGGPKCNQGQHNGHKILLWIRVKSNAHHEREGQGRCDYALPCERKRSTRRGLTFLPSPKRRRVTKKKWGLGTEQQISTSWTCFESCWEYLLCSGETAAWSVQRNMAGVDSEPHLVEMNTPAPDLLMLVWCRFLHQFFRDIYTVEMLRFCGTGTYPHNRKGGGLVFFWSKFGCRA